MNEEIKQLAKLHDENIELKKEIERLNEVMRGYARLQIKKDRDRIIDAFCNKNHQNFFSQMINHLPIKLD